VKPNCYDCVYRKGLSGSAHSKCNHPSNKEIMSDPLAEIMGIFASVGRIPAMDIPNNLNVKGKPHGIKMGWFSWPFNFDPVWLESCDGFKEIKHAKVEDA